MIPSLAKRREPLSYSIDKLGRRDEIVLKSSMRVLDHRFRHHWNFQESGGDVRVTTDAQGKFSFKPAKRQNHTFVIEGGEGHRAEWTVESDELPASLPAR